MNKKFWTALALVLISCSPAFAAGDAKRGAQLFASNCEMCHPGAGNSMSPDKPLKGAGFAAKYPTDSSIVNVLRHGIKNTVMSPFPPDRLSDAQVDDIVAYLRSLTPAPKTSGASAGPGKKVGGEAKGQASTKPADKNAAHTCRRAPCKGGACGARADKQKR